MIEIIKKGVVPKKLDRKYRKKCWNCKTIFTYQKIDRHVFGYEPDNWYYGVYCPVCKKSVSTSIFDRREKNK